MTCCLKDYVEALSVERNISNFLFFHPFIVLSRFFSTDDEVTCVVVFIIFSSYKKYLPKYL